MGRLTASARLDPAGRLSGEFAVPNLNLAFLAPFTRRYADLGGTLSITGSLGGTRANPAVEAELSAPQVSVAGTPLSGIEAQVRLQASAATREARLAVPRFSFRQNGTAVRVADAAYDTRTGRLAADLSLSTGDIGVLLGALRRSGLADTEQGARLVAALNRLPQPIYGSFSVENLAVRGRITGQGFVDRNIQVALSASDVQIGHGGPGGSPLRADSLTLAGSLDGDVIRLEGLTVKNDATDTTITARGAADLDGPIDLVLESSNASLALARAFAPGLRLDGRVDLSVTARGATRTPTVTASLEGRDVSLGGVTIDLLRIPRAVLRPAAGQTAAGLPPGEIDLSEVLVLSGGGEARVTGSLPFSYADFSLPADQPIDLQARAARQSLDLIAALAPAVKAEWVGGAFTAQLDLEGTLRDPELSGFVRVADGRFNPPGDAFPARVNSVRDLDLYIGFEGSAARVREFTLALGGPGGAGGDYGRVTASGQIDLSNLQALSSLFRRGTQPARAGALDLVVSFDGARLVAENLLNRGAAARGRLNGDLTITGPLEQPVIATRRGAPLVVADAQFQTPTQEAPENRGGGTYPVNPRFDVALSIERRAAITSQNTFRIEAGGALDIAGTLAAPNIRGSLDVLGGFFRLPTARFVIQRGGEIDLAFRPPDEPLFRVSGLVARTTLYPLSGVTPSLGVRANQGMFASATPPSTGRSTRYRITAVVDGSLVKRLPGGESEVRLDPEDLDLSSDPPLDERQIVALIGSEQQIARAIGGDVQGALSQTFTQVLNSSLVPSLLSPLERSVASAFGLEEFALEYNPDAPLTLRLVRRFPDPFERFVVSYTRGLGRTGLGPGVPEPYDLRLLYELGPRLQIGVSADEQRDYVFFLSGSLSY